jgi:2,3-diketo-5-methylthiopentyl-1-phosphate enolase
VIARYRVETDAPNLEKLATAIAVGQTLGTLEAAERPEFAPYLARVVNIQEVPAGPESPRFAWIDITFPLATVQSDIGALLTVLFGKISMGGKIRLEDLWVPPAMALASPLGGPRHGVQGVRQRLGVPDSNVPLLMSIFKPCLGVAPNVLGELFYQQAVGGVHLVKDDEILSDPTVETALRRLAACLEAAQRAQQETGHTTLYAINLTGPADQLLERARTLVREGATALLFNYLSYGLPMLAALANDPQVNRIPLMAHPSLAGSFYGSPAHGISPQVIFGRLPRLAGADLVLFPSPYGSVSLPMEEAMAVKDALLATAPAGGPVPLPVPSAGIRHEMVPEILRDFGTEVVINAGTGIHDHPEGSQAGAKAFVQAIQSAQLAQAAS